MKDNLITDYQLRIENHKTLRDAEQEALKAARRLGDPDSELAIRRAEIRRRNDLIQLCTQIIKDLESL